jgi:hypothetical protein
MPSCVAEMYRSRLSSAFRASFDKRSPASVIS